MTERREIAVHGIVQGVGFRPFVYSLAQKHRLAGFVRNDSAGVTIELEGEAPALDSFMESLSEAPPLAQIERISCQRITPKGEAGFAIIDSHTGQERQVPITPDSATCNDCLRELFDRRDRRYRYPFINCTRCGPRFTIVKDVPYDRPLTTMAGFRMCADCEREYHDPADRRFHAQPNACPACGPELVFKNPDGSEARGDQALVQASALLQQGKILALKGLGGYHLACNAFDDAAVMRLRQRKQREDKPFALMASDVAAVQRLCLVEAAEKTLLLARERPIVLLRTREPSSVAAAVAPAQRRLGVMLPYTPLHHLLLDACGLTLVMTSGNLSGEPIAFDDAEAVKRLSAVADGFLMHNRPIHMRCDDSVAHIFAQRTHVIRRSRGYAPAPVHIGRRFAQPILACGAELKNTFCLAKDDRAFLSHHIGDLANYEAYRSYTGAIEHYQRLFDIRPTIIAHDLHPQYLSTQYAQQINGVTHVAVQHHHAHIASCMAEHRLTGPVLGVAFDGLGYGNDGAIWGGEFLIAEYSGYERVAHLRYVPLAGGDTAIRQPWRAALSYLHDAVGCSADPHALALPHWENIANKQIALAQAIMQRGLNSVRTSSSGRLFDAVASILGLRHEVNYEGQAAIELEAVAHDGVHENYPFEIGAAIPKMIDFRPAIAAIVADVQQRKQNGWIAAKFHNTVSGAIVETCRQLRQTGAPRQLCLSGGTFQNVYLIERLLPALSKHGFEVFLNARVPTNDSGIAVGQALVANEIAQCGG